MNYIAVNAEQRTWKRSVSSFMIRTLPDGERLRFDAGMGEQKRLRFYQTLAITGEHRRPSAIRPRRTCCSCVPPHRCCQSPI